MGGLKTLSDMPAQQDADADAAAAKPGAEGGVSTSLDTNGAATLDTNGADPAITAPSGPVADLTIDVDAAIKAAVKTAIADVSAQRDEVAARADKLETDYLAQSDKLAAANAALEKAKGEMAASDKIADAATAMIAKLEAQITALGATPPAPVEDVKIVRPKAGKVLKLPDEGKRAKGGDVHGALAEGALLVLVLADDNGRVQPYPAQVGGGDMFTAHGTGLLFAGAIDLNPERDAVEMRFAVLLDVDGKVLSSCRLSAMLLGGGGLSAMIPGNSLRFEFD